MSSSDNRCCCCCNLICKLLQFAVSVGLVVLFYWLIFHPRLPRVAVENIRVAAFDLTDNSTTLRFNLTVRLAVRNPNRRVRIYYDNLDAAVLYHGTLLQSTPLPPFFQPTKDTAERTAGFDGHAADAGQVAALYGTEKSQGLYSFEVKLDAKLRMKLWFIKIGHFYPKFDCEVGVAPPRKDGGVSSNETWVACRR